MLISHLQPMHLPSCICNCLLCARVRHVASDQHPAKHRPKQPITHARWWWQPLTEADGSTQD